LANSFDKTLMGAAAAGGGPSDDEFNRVSFLSHFEGSNNGVNNAFDDGSSSNHTITANGDVTQGSFGPFARPDGEWGVSFDGTGDSLAIASSADFALGTGDFTVEFFVYHRGFSSGVTYFDYRTTSVENTLYFWQNGATGVVYLRAAGVNHSFTPPSMLGKWTHMAISRASSTTKVFVDGVQKLSFSDSVDYVQGTTFTISEYSLASGAESVDGFISNFRWIKGTALYTSAFTPPTTALTAVTNTKLLTCQSNRFVDNSASSHTVTLRNNAAVTAFGPFLTSAAYKPAVNGASAYMDGTGDYLNTAASSEFAVGTGDFTISVWVYNLSGSLGLFDIGASGTGLSTGYDAPSIGITGSGAPGLYLFGFGGGSSVYSTAATGSTINEWEYITLVRSGSTVTFYKNGIAGATKTSSHDVTENIIAIGGYYSTSYLFKGYMSDFRLVKGTAVYTGNFTPPTAPLTAITNTKLLLNMADGQAIDSAAQNNLTLYGTAKTSTAQKKFGTASLLLDGNSDYATFLENGGNDIDGVGNWTVEFFWRFVNKTSPSIQEIISKGAGFQLYTINGSLGFALSANNSGNYFINSTGGTTLDNDTFYHIALVKNGTSYKLYLNGTSDLSATSSSNIDTGGYPWFLGTLSGAESTYPSNGYMDEVRISKVARYTSNFTAPTEPFADKGQ